MSEGNGAMKLVCAALMQLLSFASLAATNNGALMVTVAVVRPAAVTTVVYANGGASRTRLASRVQPKTATITHGGGIQHVLVDY